MSTWSARPVLESGSYPRGDELEAILDRIDFDEDSIGVQSSVGSTTSASYVDFSGTNSTTITKKLDDATSRLAIDWSIVVFSTSNATVMKLGANCNSVDTDIWRFIFDAATTHIAAAGTAYLTGIPAGSATVKLRWLRVSGAGTVSTDTNGWQTLRVRECL